MVGFENILLIDAESFLALSLHLVLHTHGSPFILPVNGEVVAAGSVIG